jgi:hypothetical protein
MKELQMTPERYGKIVGIMEEFLEYGALAKTWANSMTVAISNLNQYQQQYSIGNVM